MIDWNELSGYEVDEAITVDGVLDDIIKLDNGDKYRAQFDVEYEIGVGDEAVVFKQVFTEARLRESLAFAEAYVQDTGTLRDMQQRNKEMIETIKRCGGKLVIYKLLVNDTVYDVDQM